MAQQHTEPEKLFNDPIHGYITMHPLCIKIIDTPQFQRLRYLRQLGGCYFVYPGAAHNRFEHSIGVAHLARLLAETLKRNQPELNISDKDVLCVQIAGLCHDLGHGPFSHVFDCRFIPAVRPDIKWQHEQASVKMFQHLVNRNNLDPEFEKYGLDATDRTFIIEQIEGTDNQGTYSGRARNKHFLYEIVANKRNGIDVDKWDYFARDCYHLGVSNNFDHKRFMHFARVLDVDGDWQICSRDTEVSSVYEMFHARMKLHRHAYQHKTSSSIEHMITDALVKANDFIKIPGKDGEQIVRRKMSECIDDMDAYTRLTDHIFHQILTSTEPELQAARDILNNIELRRVYKCIGQSRPHDEKTKFEKKDIEDLKRQIVGNNTVISPDLLLLQLVSFDFGMKERNPIDNVRFYNKSDPNKGMRIRREEASRLLPSTFYEQCVRLYCKSRDPVKIAAAKVCFSKWCTDQKLVPSTSLFHSELSDPPATL